jgi:hypothetical protein
MNGLNPFEYLKDVLERVVSGDVKAHGSIGVRSVRPS